ncbi:MAG: MFS transporter [Gammaproteobacteria bacterium]|nr:MFS transporter [Gammaproteobacteria bacterium]
MSHALNSNLRLYPWFHSAASLMGWLPVFFLYFNQFVSLAEAMQLGAVYYFSVCVWEVPSGYFSDRAGRRITLFLSGFSLVLSYLVFLCASGFYSLALGQFFLAQGVAMMSGTDTAFLYDSLRGLGREREYESREANAQKYGFASLTIASIAGGVLGSYDLRLAYVLSLFGALWMIWLVYRFSEPDRPRTGKTEILSIFQAIGECLKKLSDTVLAWLFAVMVLMYCLEHVVFEFYQPYIKLLDLRGGVPDGSPLVSGMVIAVSMFGGILGAAYSVRLHSRLGLKVLLCCAFLIQLLIIGSFAVVLSVMMLAALFFRNFPMSAIHAPVNAVIAPRVGSHLRATYLSLQSLGARLAFSGLLWALSQTIDQENVLDWGSLSLVLREVLLIGIAGVVVLVGCIPKVLKK